MRRRALVVALLLAGLVPVTLVADDGDVAKTLGGDEVVAVLKGATELTVYATEIREAAEGDRIRGYPIKAKRVVDGKDAAPVRGRLLDPKTYGGPIAKCFNPRHAVRAEKDGEVVELIICFECNHMYVYLGEERVAVPTFGAGGEALHEALEAVLAKK